MQETIFDDSFNQVPAIRRRDVMPLALKIYVWLGMISSGLTFLNVTVQFGSFRKLMNNEKVTGILAMLPIIFILFNVLLIFLMTLLLWMEVKWAIKFNWVVGCLWLCLITSTSFVFENMAVYLLFIPFLIILAPYFILLFVIRKKWTQKAVSGRSLHPTT